MKTLLVLVAALAAMCLPATAAYATPQDDTATTTPIKHVVMLMQDNHSFDNYFGTYPGAAGPPAHTCQRLSLTRTTTKGCVKPFRIGSAPADDLGQSSDIQKRQYNNGRMDGFVAAYRRLGRDGSSSMGYYDGTDLPYYWNVADQYVLFDRFFSSTTVGSRESYLYWLAGNAPASDQALTSAAGYDALPTVFDRLDQKGVTAKFYVENLDQRVTNPANASLARSSQLIKVPLLSMKRFQDGGALAGRVVDLSEYYSDVRNGTLPAVSYVVSSGSSENPPARVGVGQQLVQDLTRELIRSRYWDTSAFLWTYDGWGGWYDHVAPPKADARGYGFRVPALLISPYAKRGVVDHTTLDYTSMLRFVESNWGLKPLSSRDAAANNMSSAFDFTAAPRSATFISTSRDPVAKPSTDSGHARPVIYALYGAAFLAVAALIASATFIKRPRHRTAPATVSAPIRRRLTAEPRKAILVEDRGPGEWEAWYAAWQQQEAAAVISDWSTVGQEPDDPWADWYVESGQPDAANGGPVARRSESSARQ